MKKMTDNDFELFICRNEKKSERRELLKRVLLAYGIKKEELSRAALCRTDLGKPYFEGLEIYFNISHSRDIWACLIGPDCCGWMCSMLSLAIMKRLPGVFFIY